MKTDPNPARPWYRQFWPWALLAIPLAGVAAGVVVAIYAYRNADVEIVRAEAVPLDKTTWQRKDAQP
jgi:hypothetical protein